MSGKKIIEQFLLKDPQNLYFRALQEEFEKGARNGEHTIEEAQAINLELSRLKARGLAKTDEFIDSSSLRQQRAEYDFGGGESWKGEAKKKLEDIISQLKHRGDNASILHSGQAHRLLESINQGTVTQDAATVAINRLVYALS